RRRQGPARIREQRRNSATQEGRGDPRVRQARRARRCVRRAGLAEGVQGEMGRGAGPRRAEGLFRYAVRPGDGRDLFFLPRYGPQYIRTVSGPLEKTTDHPAPWLVVSIPPMKKKKSEKLPPADFKNEPF